MNKRNYNKLHFDEILTYRESLKWRLKQNIQNISAFQDKTAIEDYKMKVKRLKNICRYGVIDHTYVIHCSEELRKGLASPEQVHFNHPLMYQEFKVLIKILTKIPKWSFRTDSVEDLCYLYKCHILRHWNISIQWEYLNHESNQ